MIYYVKKRQAQKVVLDNIFILTVYLLNKINILCKYTLILSVLCIISGLTYLHYNDYKINSVTQTESRLFPYVSEYTVEHKKSLKVNFQPDIVRAHKAPTRTKKGKKVRRTNNKVLNDAQWRALSDKQRQKIKEKYVKDYWKTAHKLGEKYDVHPLFVLSRPARESRFHTSEISVVNNNVAGMKYKSRMIKLNPFIFKDGNESEKYFDDDPDDTFFIFETPEKSFEGFAFWVAGKGTFYGGRVKNGTLKEWDAALCCKKCSPKYSTSCNVGDDYIAGLEILRIAKKLKLSIGNYPDLKELMKKI